MVFVVLVAVFAAFDVLEVFVDLEVFVVFSFTSEFSSSQIINFSLSKSLVITSVSYTHLRAHETN